MPRMGKLNFRSSGTASSSSQEGSGLTINVGNSPFVSANSTTWTKPLNGCVVNFLASSGDARIILESFRNVKTCLEYLNQLELCNLGYQGQCQVV